MEEYEHKPIFQRTMLVFFHRLFYLPVNVMILLFINVKTQILFEQIQRAIPLAVPKTSNRFLFLCAIAGFHKMLNSTAANQAVRKMLNLSGIGHPLTIASLKIQTLIGIHQSIKPR